MRSLQREYFMEEIRILRFLNVGEFLGREVVKQRDISLKKISCMYRFDFFLDVDGILRVGGRFRRVNMLEDVKYLVILLRRFYIIELII